MQLNGITVIFVKKHSLQNNPKLHYVTYPTCFSRKSFAFAINDDQTILVEGTMLKFKMNRYYRKTLDELTNEIFVKCLTHAILASPKIKVIW